MNSNRPDIIANDPAAREMNGPGWAPTAPRETGNRLLPARWLVALAGLAAGLAAFGFGEAAYKRIPARQVMQNTMGRIAPAVTAATQSEADVRNGALAFAVLGACLGGFLGMAGGQARGSLVATAAAGLLGGLLGAGLAAGVSLATLAPFRAARITYSDYEMAISILMHGLIWGLCGAAAGLAFAAGRGGWRLLAMSTAAGLAGAVLGAMAFEVIGAGLFPLAETGDPVSTTWASRLLARLLVALATAAGIIMVLTVSPRSPSPGRIEASTPPEAPGS